MPLPITGPTLYGPMILGEAAEAAAAVAGLTARSLMPAKPARRLRQGSERNGVEQEERWRRQESYRGQTGEME